MHKIYSEKMKPLEGDDRIRMARLYEEITGRVQEMSSIMARLHGTSSRWERFEIAPGAAAVGDSDIDVIVVVCNGDECGCHDPGSMTCGPCPDVDL